MATILPTFKGYTIDFRLSEFRKVNQPNCDIEWISFDSEEGQALLNEYMNELWAEHFKSQ